MPKAGIKKYKNPPESPFRKGGLALCPPLVKGDLLFAPLAKGKLLFDPLW
jgi:hypothetical protein